MCAHCLDFDIVAEVELCGEPGPPVAPGLPGFLCTRVARHPDDHRAWLGGRLLDVWPQDGPGVQR